MTAPIGAKINPDPWEAAYLRFETPEQEIQKFIARLRSLGADLWPKDIRIVELFCGRGNGLHSLERLGFTQLEGMDLSPTLLAHYQGSAATHVGDCRQQPFETSSRDVMISQGGLHHLPTLPDDLEQTLAEMQRVLRPGGRAVIVEPWLTPFLHVVHFCADQAMMRKFSSKLDAFHSMVQHERRTYENWLGRADEILRLFKKYFEPEHNRIGWGKIMFVGRNR